jgi:hypothetical protein
MFVQEHGLHITHDSDENYSEIMRTNPHMTDAGVCGCHLERKQEELSWVS